VSIEDLSFVLTRSLPELYNIPAAFSLTAAKPNMQFARGGITGAICCTCANSAALAEPPAAQNCQFSGFSAASRLPFQRI